MKFQTISTECNLIQEVCIFVYKIVFQVVLKAALEFLPLSETIFRN